MSVAYSYASHSRRPARDRPEAFRGLRHDPWALLFAIALNLNLWLAIAYAVRFLIS